MTEPIRSAISAAIKKNPAGLKCDAIAARAGVSPSIVYGWGEADRSPIPLAQLIQFSLITGDSRPIAALCRLAGGTFIPLPVDGADASDKDLVRSIKEFSDLAQAVSSAKVDGEVDEIELAKIQREGAECQRAIAQLLGALEAEAIR